MDRIITSEIEKDLIKKMVFITGPRQVGKTYLSKVILENSIQGTYLNFDDIIHRRIIADKSWPLNTGLLVFDEIHKMINWKSYLKGVFDTKNVSTSILVTGSARMETFRQSGESLAGRYFHYRLHPFSVKELSVILPPREALPILNHLGGFPEPFLSGSEREAERWRNQYFTDLIREDIVDFRRIQEIKSMKLLVEMLRVMVGSPVSLNSLAGDLQISPNTVKKYLDILESLYIIFSVRPYHKNIARSILKEPKYYFFDSGYVKGDEGIRLENTAACSLLKHCHYQNDVMGKTSSLFYFRTKDHKEVDFVITDDGVPVEMIEVKLSDRKISKNLCYFKSRYPQIKALQLVQNLQESEYLKEKDLYLQNAADYFVSLSC